MNNLEGIFNKPFLLDGISGTEWLETNNAGGFASSTLIERNDRKYHGLLVTPVKGFEGRYHILSAVDGIFKDNDNGCSVSTGTSRYPEAHFPEGWKYLDSVKIIPVLEYIYKNGNISVKKEIMMRDGEPAVYIIYSNVSGNGCDSVSGDLKLLFTYRNSHNLTVENGDINGKVLKDDKSMTISPYFGMPAADISFSGEWSQEGSLYWDKNICYESEKSRGLEWVEDRFVPGTVNIKLEKGIPFVIRVGIIEDGNEWTPEDLISAYDSEKKERLKNYKKPQNNSDLLKMQSAHFILKNPSGKHSINAGYPWFGEWGRDTMIALPGLTFYSGKTDLGVKILEDYISMIKDGLLPNTLGDTQGFTSYNSIDAGLLFCWAVDKMLESGYGGKKDEKKKLSQVFYPAISQILNAFFENRVPNAGMNDAGLIYSGSVDTQLTWMDATAWGRPVTPRHGYAVELNALWFGALRLNKKLAVIAGASVDKKASDLIESFPTVFQDMFWLDEGYLSDTVNDYGPDKKIRPNMLFASACDGGLITGEQGRAVVAAAEKHLLTEFGMRTLSPSDYDFKPVYSGGPDERDNCYHQGTVWPWPLGIMIESSLKAADNVTEKATEWSVYIENLLNAHLMKDGWGSVSEIFDGLLPRIGKGSFAQAWSCAEIIRASELVNRVINNEGNKEG